MSTNTTALTTEYTMSALQALKPDWTRYRFRDALDELRALEFISATAGGRGKARGYRVLTSAPPGPRTTAIRLRTEDELAKLAKVGDEDFANLSPSTKTG